MFVRTTLELLFPLGYSRHIALSSFLKVLRADIGLPEKLACLFRSVAGKKERPAVRLQESGSKTGANILLIEDCLPDPDLGSGYPRTFSLIEVLVHRGHRVTVLPVLQRHERDHVRGKLNRLGAAFFELESDGQELPVDRILCSKKGEFDVVILCRPHNMKLFRRIVRKFNPDTVLVYDAEALYANRMISHVSLRNGAPLSAGKQSRLVRKELRLAKGANCVLTVSASEKAQFASVFDVPVGVVAHACEYCPTVTPFVARQGILFVGGVLAVPSPNQDALRFLVEEILPAIQSICRIPVTVAGPGCVGSAFPGVRAGISFVGFQQDLRPLYESNRVFIAPTRYSAGIPLKVVEAASVGLPCVVTSHLHERLGWAEGVDYLTGSTPGELAEKCVLLHNDPQIWERVRFSAERRIRREFSSEVFAENLTRILKSAGAAI